MALQASSFPSSSSPSSVSYEWPYDVFLSFRDSDTRHDFTGNLHKALSDKGIRTFFGDKDYREGEEITPSHVKAIQDSRIAIVVFSVNYASSSFCLDELATIMECVKGMGRLVLPVFYDVDPCDVRRQKGGYGEAMTKHEERFKDEKGKVQKWRGALRQAANLSGKDFKPGNEYEYIFIEKIVEVISNKALFFRSSSFSYEWPYHVFLNFRGSDTRYGFTGNLYKALSDKGIRTFIDGKELQGGEEITPALVKAIQDSRIAIVVFSVNYASSSFCLHELATIMDCVNGMGRLVLPVFYQVDPCHVRLQEGGFGKAMTKHVERLNDEKEEERKWRGALRQAANLPGKDFKLGNEYQYDCIEEIVKVISKKISHIPLYIADYPVGLTSQMLELNSLLNYGFDCGVCMVEIYGIGGIGKTTLARAIYNFIADQFEGSCFLENVRKKSTELELVHLQETLLFEMFGDGDINLRSVNEGVITIKHRLHQKKVLLVLDDVDRLKQLEAIVGGADWLGSGSIVIITTRDKHLLRCDGIWIKYEVECLSEKDALELLCWNAFRGKNIDPSYMDILKDAVTFARGLPLVLEVLGSYLFGRSIEEWRSVLDLFERNSHIGLHKSLRMSFDSLEKYQQEILLY